AGRAHVQRRDHQGQRQGQGDRGDRKIRQRQTRDRARGVPGRPRSRPAGEQGIPRPAADLLRAAALSAQHGRRVEGRRPVLRRRRGERARAVQVMAGPIAATRERNPAVSTTNAQRPRADARPKADVALDLRDLRRVFLPRNNVPFEALAGVSLSVRHGEVVAILGPSGCGKSSLLRILAGLDRDYSGAIDWHVTHAGDEADRRLRSATVFQGDSTLPWLTVEDNVRIGLSGLNVDAAEAERRIAHYLGLVGLGRFRKSYPHELSGG